MKKETDEFLESMAEEYVPTKSEDPEENECADCGMTEKAHKVIPQITCGNFQEIQNEHI